MRSLDEQLREALADDRRRLEADVPALTVAVQRRAERVRRGRAVAAVVGALAAVIVVAGLAGTLLHLPASSTPPATTVSVATRAASRAPSPTPSWAALPFSGTRPTDYLGIPEDVQLWNGTLYVLAGDHPGALEAVDPVTAKTRWTVTPAAWRDLGAGTGLLRVDPDTGLLWALRGGDTATCTALAFDPATGALRRSVDVECGVFDLVAEHGRLWVSTYAGELHVLAPGTTRWATVNAISGAYALAVDRNRDRVLVDVESTRIVALDAASRAVVATAASRLGKASIAWTPDDHVWVGGYSGDHQPKLYQLDARTLTQLGSSPIATVTGAGAIVWPGDEVVWVRNGGDMGLECLDAATGEVRGRWTSVQGPVVSTVAGGGLALAADQGTLVGLDLPRGCAG